MHLQLLMTWFMLTAACLGDDRLPDKPTSHTTREIEGWQVRVDDRLLCEPQVELGIRALKMLEARLADIRSVVAEDRLAQLRKVTIVLDLSHGELTSMQYHPSVEWLVAHGYAKDLATCVHIPVASEFVQSRQVNEQPWAVLHELAHAFHDQQLGFDNPRIRSAFEQYKHSGNGDATLLYNGSRVRHYALTDPQEFFAEMSEAYIGSNDFFPFNGAELLTAEPAIFALMCDIWGPVQRTPDRAKSHTTQTPAP